MNKGLVIAVISSALTVASLLAIVYVAMKIGIFLLTNGLGIIMGLIGILAMIIAYKLIKGYIRNRRR